MFRCVEHSDPRSGDQRLGDQRRRAAAGFSLIELLVVVGIILILSGIVITLVLEKQGPVVQTRTALQTLKGAASEYQVVMGTPVSHDAGWGSAKAKNAPDADGSAIVNDTDGENGPNDLHIERFIWAAWQLPETRSMLASLPGVRQGESAAADILVDLDADGFMEVRDGWGNMMDYRDSNDHDDGDKNRPARRSPFFCSPGPDGAWGDYSDGASAANAAKTEDNFHSFDLD